MSYEGIKLVEDITTAGSLVHKLEKSYFVAIATSNCYHVQRLHFRSTCMVTRSVIAIAMEIESSLFMAGSVVVK